MDEVKRNASEVKGIRGGDTLMLRLSLSNRYLQMMQQLRAKWNIKEGFDFEKTVKKALEVCYDKEFSS